MFRFKKLFTRMEDAGRREKQTFCVDTERLKQLGEKFGVPVNDPRRNLQRPELPKPLSEQDSGRLKQVIQHLRSELSGSSKLHKILRASLATTVLNLKSVKDDEATYALQKLLATDCSATEAITLLELGADVNRPGLRVHRTLSDLVEIDNNSPLDNKNAFRKAIDLGRADLVNAMVDSASTENLNKGLQFSIQQKNMVIMEILMAMGADPNQCGAEYRQLIKSNNTEALSIFLSGTRPLSKELATEGLYEMVKRGNVDIFRMLLRSGADITSSTRPSALRHAIEQDNKLYIAILCTCGTVSDQIELAVSVYYVCNRSWRASPSQLSQETLDLVQMLLLGVTPASGTYLKDLLMEAIAKKEYDLIEILFANKGLSTVDLETAIARVVDATDLRLLRILLGAGMSSKVLDECFVYITCTKVWDSAELTAKKNMMTEVLSHGVSPSLLGRPLCDFSEQLALEMVNTLIRAGAPIDYRDGHALTIAVEKQSASLLSILLQAGFVPKDVLNRTLRLVDGLPLVPKLEMTTLLLRAGATGPDLDDLLQKVVARDGKSPETYQLITVLLKAGAIVRTTTDGCLIAAIENEDMTALKLLRDHIPREDDLEAAFQRSLLISDLDVRYNVMHFLLLAGARGRFVSKALIDVLERMPRETRFSRILVDDGKPDINLFDGKAVSLAVKHQHLDLLQSQITLRPSEATLNKALKTAMRLESGETRIKICAALLEAGASGTEVDDALVRASVLEPCEMDLIELLLKHGASIDHKSGSVLQLALANFDLKLLDLLVQQNALASTMNRALGQAMALANADQKLIACTSLLKAKISPSPECMGAFLAQALHDSGDLRLFQLLLNHGASVNVKPLEAFRKSIRLNSSKAMQALMKANPTIDTVQEAFAYAWKDRAINGFDLLESILTNSAHSSEVPLDDYIPSNVTKTPSSNSDLMFLMTHGATGIPKEYGYLKAVAKTFSTPRKCHLIDIVRRQTHIPKDLAEFLELDESWDAPLGQLLFIDLMASSGSWRLVNRLLLSAAENYNQYQGAPFMTKILVLKDADLDYKDGQALLSATQRAIVPLIRELLKAWGSRSIVNKAFPYIFRSAPDVQTVVQTIEAFSEDPRKRFDINETHDELPPLPWLFYERVDKNVDLLDALVRAGAKINESFNAQYDDCPVESATLLQIMADHPSSDQSTAIIRSLISRGANVNFMSPESKITALMSAASFGNVEVVAALIKAGANVAHKDSEGKTAMLHAITGSCHEIVVMLTEARAPTNDGSLHAAVALGSTGIVTLLLDAGHDPDMCDPRHEMQRPLEIAIRAKGGCRRDVLSTLFLNGADPTYQKDGKPLLFMALDMKDAAPVVPLLNAFMDMLMNQQFNLFQKGSLVYSALSYVKQDQANISADRKRDLIEMLTKRGCKEIFYHKYGPQPVGHKGTPAELLQKDFERQTWGRSREEELRAQRRAHFRKLFAHSGPRF